MKTYAKAVDVLDSLTRRLLCTGWDEKIRRQAMDCAARIATFGAPDAPRHARAISRGLVSLLALNNEADLRPRLEQRLLELVACLRDGAPAEDVGA